MTVRTDYVCTCVRATYIYDRGVWSFVWSRQLHWLDVFSHLFCGQARGNQTLSGSISMDESLIHASIFRKKRHESTLTSPAQSYFTVKQSNSEEAAFDEAEQMSLGDFNQSSGPF